MKQRGWSEQEAYQALRKKAMERSMNLRGLAQQVIAMADLMD
jgi:response regulator NasT